LSGLDTAAVRAEFPLLGRELAGQPIAYLDAASTAPKPRRVLEAIRRYHEEYTGNVHRGVHPLAAEASAAYEAARHAAAAHLGASAGEIVFTRGTTEAINFVASSLRLGSDDEVVLTHAEHHSNMLPWRACAKPVYLPSRDDGSPEWEALESAITPKTKLVAVHHVSNVLGTIAPVAEIARVARARSVPLLLDGAQAAGHLPVDVGALDCDFYAFSGHKVGGPTGVGVLYARSPWLERLAPYHWGGGMVSVVDESTLELKGAPHRFEAGTPNVEGVLGLAAALELLREVGMESVRAHGEELARTLLEGVRDLPGVRVLGAGEPLRPRIPLVALELPEDGLDAQTLARTLADSSGVIVSAGQHCTHPLHRRATASQDTLRASAWMINTRDDVARFVESLRTWVR
jgi:cysteine desulfurase/selenocysteine lyase